MLIDILKMLWYIYMYETSSKRKKGALSIATTEGQTEVSSFVQQIAETKSIISTAMHGPGSFPPISRCSLPDDSIASAVSLNASLVN